jgi:hypothetical protein
MISTSPLEGPKFAWFDSFGALGKLTFGFDEPEKNLWGGDKYPECTIWAGAFNHFDIGLMLKHLESLAWEEPDFVQVMVKEQDEETFKVYMFDNGKLSLILPSRKY